LNHFDVRPDLGGELCCEDVPLSRIAEAVGTPVYVYSTATLERHFAVFRAAFTPHRQQLGAPLVAYAVKANSNLSVLRTLAALGAGADTVSEGEIRRALAAGIPGERIVFSGVAKTATELAFALGAEVHQINVESAAELARIEAVAAELGRIAPVALRVNPQVRAGGHDKIATGKAESKFGVALAEVEALYARAAASPHLQPVGLACHIGSQIVDLAPLEETYRKLAELARSLRAAGLPVERLDLGGGLGAPYFHQPEPPGPEALAALAAKTVGDLGVQVIFEPGRVIAANAGVLLAGVVHVTERPDGRRFVVLDAGMNDLLRPAMYDAFHDLRSVRPAEGMVLPHDVVGPVCESSDVFAVQRPLPPLKDGDLVAFMTAGAYGAAMASEYNTRPLVPEVLVRGGEFAVVRARESYDQILARETPAPWL
jgi:diaminopimelate decarboxylase